MSDTDANSDAADCPIDKDQLRPGDLERVPAPPVSDVQQVRCDALQTIIGETTQASPPKEWEFLGKSDEVRQMDGERHDLVASLRRELSDEQLVKSRILIRRRDALQLNSVFGERSAKFLIRFDSQGRPMDAFSARGTLSLAGPSILPLAQARRPAHAAAKRGVLVASQDDDLTVLCRLGYSCVPAAGLGNLSGRVVEAILADPKAAKFDYQFKLAIVVGSISQCTSTPSKEVRQILSHLQQIEPVYGRRPHSLFIVSWFDDAALQKIRAALTFRHRNGFLPVFNKALVSSLFELDDAWSRLAQPEDNGIVGAHCEVQDALANDNPIKRLLDVRQALPRLQRHLAAATVDKCRQAAQLASDPITSALYLEYGQLLQQTIAENPLVAAAEEVLGLPSNARGGEGTTMDQRQRIDALLRMHRAVSPK